MALPNPPKRTIWLLAASYAIAAAPLAEGLLTGLCCVQVLPFQVQVSLRWPLLPNPPKRTTWLLAASYAIVASDLAGGLVTGLCSVQVLPFQVQVSFRAPLLPDPPKRTTWPLAASYAIVANVLAEGAPDRFGSVQTDDCVTCANRRGEAPAAIPRKASSASRGGNRTHGGQPTRAEHQKATQATPKINLKPGNTGQTTAPQDHPETSAHNTRSSTRQGKTYRRKPSTTQGQAAQATEQIHRKSC